MYHPQFEPKLPGLAGMTPDVEGGTYVDRQACQPWPPVLKEGEDVLGVGTTEVFDPLAALKAAGISAVPEEIELDQPIVEPEDVMPPEDWQHVVEEAQELREAEPEPAPLVGARRIPIALREGTSEFTQDDASKIGTGAIKYDGGKPAVWRGVINYFPRALWGVAEISTFGANKYAWNGWEDVEDGYARYQDAKFRHALKDAMGEENDPDSELLHLKHEAWGALAALELALREREKRVRF